MPNPSDLYPDLSFAPDQWIDVSDPDGPLHYQHKVNPEIFSHDQGETWYDLDGNRGSRA